MLLIAVILGASFMFVLVLMNKYTACFIDSTQYGYYSMEPWVVNPPLKLKLYGAYYPLALTDRSCNLLGREER
jgi:hypothetical protein